MHTVTFIYMTSSSPSSTRWARVVPPEKAMPWCSSNNSSPTDTSCWPLLKHWKLRRPSICETSTSFEAVQPRLPPPQGFGGGPCGFIIDGKRESSLTDGLVYNQMLLAIVLRNAASLISEVWKLESDDIVSKDFVRFLICSGGLLYFEGYEECVRWLHCFCLVTLFI